MGCVGKSRVRLPSNLSTIRDAHGLCAHTMSAARLLNNFGCSRSGSFLDTAAHISLEESTPHFSLTRLWIFGLDFSQELGERGIIKAGWYSTAWRTSDVRCTQCVSHDRVGHIPFWVLSACLSFFDPIASRHTASPRFRSYPRIGEN